MPGLRDFLEHKMRADRLAANEAPPEFVGQHWPEQLDNGDKKAPRQALQFYLSTDCDDQGMPLSLTVVDVDHHTANYHHSAYAREDLLRRAKNWVNAVGWIALGAGILIGYIFTKWTTPAL